MGRRTRMKDERIVPYDPKFNFCARCGRRLPLGELFFNRKRNPGWTFLQRFVLSPGALNCRDDKACRRARRRRA